jgi:hypothetical protein
MKVMAAKVSAEGESFETSTFLWRDIYESTADPSVKKTALLNLQLVKAKEDCKHLDALADAYAKRFGRRPSRMSEMVEAGLLGGIPGDPLGYAYVFGEDGKAELNLESPLLEQQLLLDRYRKAVPRN